MKPVTVAELGDDVDRDIRTFQRQVNAAYNNLSGGSYADVAERRRIAEEVRKPWVAGGPQMAGTNELRVGDSNIRIRIYRPTDEPGLPVLIYLHGGGWMLFSIDTHDRLMREYAARSGCAVVGVDYRLAPEARYPCAILDVGEVIQWLHANGESFGLNAKRIAIGGDSAGGNLAIASALRIREAGEKWISALLLNYAVLDNRPRQTYKRYDGDGYMLEAAEMADFWDNYLSSPVDATDPLAVPMLADVHGLPPTFLCVAECDILVEENLEMAGKLANAGNDVRVELYKGATHSFLEAMSISPLAVKAIDDAAGWLREKLAR